MVPPLLKARARLATAAVVLIAAVALLHYDVPPVPTWFYVLAWYPTLDSGPGRGAARRRVAARPTARAGGDAVVVGRHLAPVRGDQLSPPELVLRVPAAAPPGPLGRHHHLARHGRARRAAAGAPARATRRVAAAARPAHPAHARAARGRGVDRLGHARAGARVPPVPLSPHRGSGVARGRAAVVRPRSRALP